MTVSNELIDQLFAGYKKPEDLIGENGLLKQLTKRLVERALEAEMTEHLGHTKNASVATFSISPAGMRQIGSHQTWCVKSSAFE